MALPGSPPPFEPQFSHPENGDNEDTELALSGRGKWDEKRAKGFGAEVEIKGFSCS